MKNICIFTGARPNFIKVAPLIRAIERTENCQYQLVYAGTADDPTLEPSLFRFSVPTSSWALTARTSTN